jgi:hypothetical protein
VLAGNPNLIPMIIANNNSTGVIETAARAETGVKAGTLLNGDNGMVIDDGEELRVVKYSALVAAENVKEKQAWLAIEGILRANDVEVSTQETKIMTEKEMIKKVHEAKLDDITRQAVIDAEQQERKRKIDAEQQERKRKIDAEQQERHAVSKKLDDEIEHVRAVNKKLEAEIEQERIKKDAKRDEKSKNEEAKRVKAEKAREEEFAKAAHAEKMSKINQPVVQPNAAKKVAASKPAKKRKSVAEQGVELADRRDKLDFDSEQSKKACGDRFKNRNAQRDANV